MSEIKSLKEIVETLLECNYECEAGPLKNNKDFRLLAKMAGVELPKSVGEGVVDLKKAFENMAHSIANNISYTSDQRRRDEIVERAKRDIKVLVDRGKDASLYNDTQDGNETYRRHFYAVEFHVNKEKRTVVALIRHRTWFNRGGVLGKIKHRGIAKCAPQDCFNVHIGKAIALRRALGLEVPDEYLNAPQPTEVRVGDVILSKGNTYKITDSFGAAAYLKGYAQPGSPAAKAGKVIDDTREEV